MLANLPEEPFHQHVFYTASIRCFAHKVMRKTTWVRLDQVSLVSECSGDRKSVV